VNHFGTIGSHEVEVVQVCQLKSKTIDNLAISLSGVVLNKFSPSCHLCQHIPYIC
jgi:hypothetical protein